MMRAGNPHRTPGRGSRSETHGNESRDDSRLSRLIACATAPRASACSRARFSAGVFAQKRQKRPERLVGVGVCPLADARGSVPESSGRTPHPEGCATESGVTLIELLVAVTLVALLSTGMAIVLRVALDGSQKSQAHLTTNRRVIGVERVMREEITNLMPVNTACGSEGQFAPLFEGRPQSLRFVSSYSLAEAARG